VGQNTLQLASPDMNLGVNFFTQKMTEGKTMDTETFKIETLEMGPHEAAMMYSGAVCKPGALALQREINRLFEYYKYPRITLTLESPGGAIDGLDFILRSMTKWANAGKHVAVRSTFLCASAAAYLLAMGQWGHRSVDRGTLLLFHNARISGASVSDMTAASTTHISRTLNGVDRKLLDALVGKLVKESGGPTELARLIESRLQFVDVNWSELALEFDTFTSSADATRLPTWIKPVQKLLRSGSDPAKFVVELKKLLAVRFLQESSMNTCEAWVLTLIDEISGVLDAMDFPLNSSSNVTMDNPISANHPWLSPKH
jgi:ATP-dependent protease ClpP protease subunit